MGSEHTPGQYPRIWQVVIVILISIFITFLTGIIGTLIGLKTELFLLEALIIVPAVIFTLRTHYSPVLVFRLRPVSRKVIITSIFIGIAFTILSDEIDRLVQLVLPTPEIFRKLIEASLKIQSTSDLIIIVFSAVFLAAIVEELLFRGFVQTSFEKHFDVTKGVMSTALIFAVFHFNPWWGIQILIFGILLGVMAWKSNSVVPSIIVHFINNGFSLIFVNASPEAFQWYLFKNHVSIPILLSAIIVTIYGMKLFYQFCDSSASG